MHNDKRVRNRLLTATLVQCRKCLRNVFLSLTTTKSKHKTGEKSRAISFDLWSVWLRSKSLTTDIKLRLLRSRTRGRWSVSKCDARLNCLYFPQIIRDRGGVLRLRVSKFFFQNNLGSTTKFWVKWNTSLMQHCAGFISAESLYMFRAQAPIIRSI